MNPLTRLYWTLRAVGWDNLPRRTLQAVRVRTGWLAGRLSPDRFSDAACQANCHAPADQQKALWQTRAEKFFPKPTPVDLAAVAEDATWAASVTAIAERALAGNYPFFSRWSAPLGWPPEFNLDPIHHVRTPIDRPAACSARSGPPGDDIKLIWEPSRLSLAFCLAQAYVRSGDPKWAEGFWTMLDAWFAQNPPMQSAAWGCGQETTFRLMAALFAAVATLDSPAATGPRLANLTRFAWRTGRLIDTNINYALSQKNNHGISEATGLWTVGLLFPEFGESARWRDRGRRILAAEVRRQIYDDGSYVQHSLNYHRVMLDDLLWAIRLGELNNVPLDDGVYDRFRRATDWLIAMIDPASGRVPNYGPNDGANVLPLNCCDYLDYRPVAQAADFLLRGERAFPPGPWDEKMLWLFGPKCLDAPLKPPARAASFAAPHGGYFVLRGRQSWAMTRCHSFRDRPNQADMLHVDLWSTGLNVLRDGGSYVYYHADPRWQHYFLSTAAHNTVELDRLDQMVKGPRFLWFRWTQSRRRAWATSDDGHVGYFEGEHRGYRSLPGRPIHRRAICRIGDDWVVIDDLLGAGSHRVALRWRLMEADWRQGDNGIWSAGQPAPLQLAVAGPLASRLLRGQADPICGWESLYYGEKTAAPTLEAAGECNLPVRLITVLAAGESMTVAANDQSIKVQTASQSIQLDLGPLADDGVIVPRVQTGNRAYAVSADRVRPID